MSLQEHAEEVTTLIKEIKQLPARKKLVCNFISNDLYRKSCCAVKPSPGGCYSDDFVGVSFSKSAFFLSLYTLAVVIFKAKAERQRCEMIKYQPIDVLI